MLPRVYRLPSSLFLDVKKNGALVQGKVLSAVVLKRQDANNSRFGIIVSTKVSKNAVDRNKVKRVIRSFIIKSLSSMTPGIDVAILSKSSILNSTQAEIERDLRDVFVKAKLL